MSPDTGGLDTLAVYQKITSLGKRTNKITSLGKRTNKITSLGKHTNKISQEGGREESR